MNGTSRQGLLRVLFICALVLPPLFFGIRLVNAPAPLPAATPFVIPVWEQATLFGAAFIIKPLYMTLALVIAFLLRHRGEADLTALRRGMILFFLGELACAANYLIFRDKSPLMEYWHNYGMVCAFAFCVFALMEAFDKRLVHFSDEGKRCALLSQCGGCYKQHDMICTMRTLSLYLIPALAMVTAMPLTAPLGNRFFIGTVFGEQVLFGHPLSGQMIEVRFFPAMAACFLLLAFGVLLFQREKGFGEAKLLVALGLGPLAFGLMRFICYWGYGEHPLWADVWEEGTEFLFIVVILRIALLVRSRAGNGKAAGATTAPHTIPVEDQ